MENYDALFEGVKDGGLRSRSEIKLLICYIVCKTDGGITKNQLSDILTSESLVNYFEATQAISDVIHNGNITSEFKDGEEYLYPTPLGKFNTAELENSLPYTVREAALNAAYALLTKLKTERENQIEISPHGSGFDVTISVTDGEDRLLTLTVFTADAEQANGVKEKFLQDPVKTYSTILALLLA